MAKLAINRGSAANDGTGDNLRAGANKINLNFDEIYSAIGDGSSLSASIKVKDDSSTVSTIAANGAILGILGGSGISSTVSGSNITLSVDGSISSASGAQTLTNKVMSGADNTFSNIGNSSLSNSSITVSDGSNTSPVALGGTLTFAGTTNEIEVGESAGTVTVGLPDNVTIAGNLTVNGTTTTVNSTTIEVTNSFTFEGTTSDDFETTLTVVDPTADRTVSIPNATGTIVLKDTTDTLTNKTINGPDNTLTNIPAANVTGVFDNTSSGHKLKFNFANTGSFPSSSTYEGMFAYDYGGNNAYVADAAGWVKLISENNSIADISNVGNISGIQNGQALLWNSGAGRFDPGNVSVGGSDIDQANSNIQDLGYLSYRSSSNTPTKTLTVTVASQTAEHYYNGTGSSNKYVIDGDQGPFLSLAPGIYRFDQADGSNSGHPLLFYRDAAKATAYTTGVTTNGSPGSAGAYTQITIDKDTPQVLYYQCSAHGYMGHALQTVGSEVSFGASNGFAIAMSIAL